MAVPKAFTLRGEEGPAPEDITDDEVLLKLLKARIATAAGYFEVLEFCKLNEGDKGDIEWLAERSKEHWTKARDLIRERRELDRLPHDRAPSRPPRPAVMAAEAATGK